MKNFEFLKDFDKDMYILLSEFEKEIMKNPKTTESYVTPFLEKVVNDILQRNNNGIDNPYVGFSKRVDKLYQLKIIDFKFKCMLLEAYQMRNAITHKSIEDFLKQDNKIPFQLHRSLFDIAWKYFELCNENYYYPGKPKYTPIYNLNSKTTKITPEPSNNRNFKHCIICGKINDSKNSNFCRSCNNELEYQNEIINLKNNLNINHFTKEDVNQIHSSMYTNQLLIELSTKNLIKKTNRYYKLNQTEYEKLIKFTYNCYDMEKTLIEFLEGKYTSKQIKQTSYYKCGQKSIKPFVEFYKIVENQIFKDFLDQISMKMPIDEIFEKTQVNKSQANNWYRKNKEEFIKGEHNQEFIIYNKLLMDQYLTLKRKQYLSDEIKTKLQINDEIIQFWLNSFNMESSIFKKNLQKIKMDIFLNNLKEGKSKEESLKLAEITDFKELLKDNNFENEYKREYYENRVNNLLKYLKTMSFNKALEKANITKNDYDMWYIKGKKQCLLKKEDDTFTLNFYINVTHVLMDKYLRLRSEGKTKMEASKKINMDLNEVKRWCKWNESGLFIDFKQNNAKIIANLVIDAIKNGKSKDKLAKSSDITLHELNKILNLGSNGHKIYGKVYEEYESNYLSKHLEIFLEEIKNKNLQKALKISGIEKTELDNAYDLGKNGDKRFNDFYNDYLNFKINCYINQIIKGKSSSIGLKNSNLTKKELEDNLTQVNEKILEKQMNIVINEIINDKTTKQAAKKANVKIEEVYNWYLEGKNGNKQFKEFMREYYEYYIEPGCEIFQNFLDKGKSPKTILKIMKGDITKEDYEFWKKEGFLVNKNVEAKLYSYDEIKEKVENSGFRQKVEKTFSGLSIMNY
ncbi:DNA repair ATPase [uncultured Methanobrevibacter sp.]|uniref:DNA repair ATPase n=1 Tax=uncultured Methanobrevibacter sp. TaxID=253161 RepID=UPI0026099368|nr:DNA repair ATPase [uncultured Methanobrevibacter sp.]